jgi:hypothetical protein
MAQKSITASMKYPSVFLVIKFILVIGIICNLLRTIIPIKEKYLNTDYWKRYAVLKKNYYDSIYANKNGSFIPDESLYAYEGGALISGTSPILVNPEIPPLGKYLIGVSSVIFNNENIIILLAGSASLFLLYLIGVRIFTLSITRFIPPFLLSFEPIFTNQFIYVPLLDIVQLFFLLAAQYCFILGMDSRKRILLLFSFANIFLGCFISTKFFASGICILIAWYIVILIHKDIKRLKFLFYTTPLAMFILFITYIKVLFTGYGLRHFLGIQKWIFLYNTGHLHFPFSVWQLILLNRWQTWWGGQQITSDPQWRITWPFIVVATFMVIFFYLGKKIIINVSIEVILAWIVCYFLFISLGDASTRYFVILIPLLYLVMCYGIEKIILRFIQKRTKNNLL